MGVSEEPVQRIAFSSCDEGETEDFIRQTYVDNRTRFLAVPEGARFSAEAVVGAEVAADRVESDVDYVARCEPWDHLCFVQVFGGRFDILQRSGEVTILPGEHFFYPVGGSDLTVTLSSVDCLTVRLPMERLERLATELFGVRPGDLRFNAVTPVSDQAARRWGAVMALANEEVLAEDSVAAHPLVQEQLLRTVAITALHTFPNTALAATHVPPQPAAVPASIRRAAAFLEDNAHRPVTTQAAATAAGLSPRALHEGFRRHLDVTPQEHLRRARLEHAHRELQATHPAAATSVRQVARRWGFADTGEFVARYRAAYGRAPHETLRS